MKQRIGDRYEFDRATDIIGRGGMGTVYKGIDTTTGQIVAIKQLKPDIIEDNPDFVERFTREAEALRRLNHPNIVTALDTLIEDDANYLIMEYVGGGSLWDEMQNTKPMPVSRVLQIALDLCDALTRAHRLKIVHRDLKPANILIAEDGTPRLTDFGVAQIQDRTRVTRTGAMIGTLNYLSPEALNGDPTDERSDIWSFGIMLYEMLAGRSPFPEENTTALITSILTKPVPDLTIFRADVPPDLVNLVGNMLIKDPEDRIDSIRKVGSELEDIIRHADSKTDLAPEIKRQIIVQRESRFDTPISSSPSFSISKPVTKPTVGVVKSDTGEEYILVSRQAARGFWLIAILLVVASVGIGIFLLTRPPQTPSQSDNTTSLVLDNPPNNNRVEPTRLPNNQNLPQQQFQLLMASPIEMGEYPILILPGSGPQTDDAALQATIYNELSAIFESQIDYSSIRVFADAPAPTNGGVPPSFQQLGQLGNNAQAILMVRPEQRQDGLHAYIELVDMGRLSHTAFERGILARVMNTEVLVNSPSDLAPYLVVAMAIAHSADGDLFEFIRALTMLSDLPPANGTIVKTGVSQSVYDYFLNFTHNQGAAMQLINTAIERDGGNALLFTYRALAHMRQLNFESARSDILSAKRVGPETWTLPNYISLMMTTDNSVLELTNSITTQRPNDWFAHFVRAHFTYLTNDLTGAGDIVAQSLRYNPQSNVSNLLASFIAIRQGRIEDAHQLLDDILREYPNPTLTARGMNMVFGDSITGSSLIYATYANLLIGQFDRVISETDLLITMTPPEGADLPYLYVADVLMIRGVAFCSQGKYDDARLAFTMGLTADPTNYMLHALRADISLYIGEDASADIELALGLSDEMDMYVAKLTDESRTQATLPCSQFVDLFINQVN